MQLRRRTTDRRRRGSAPAARARGLDRMTREPDARPARHGRPAARSRAARDRVRACRHRRGVRDRLSRRRGRHAAPGGGVHAAGRVDSARPSRLGLPLLRALGLSDHAAIREAFVLGRPASRRSRPTCATARCACSPRPGSCSPSCTWLRHARRQPRRAGLGLHAHRVVCAASARSLIGQCGRSRSSSPSTCSCRLRSWRCGGWRRVETRRQAAGALRARPARVDGQRRVRAVASDSFAAQRSLAWVLIAFMSGSRWRRRSPADAAVAEPPRARPAPRSPSSRAWRSRSRRAPRRVVAVAHEPAGHAFGAASCGAR